MKVKVVRTKKLKKPICGVYEDSKCNALFTIRYICKIRVDDNNGTFFQYRYLCTWHNVSYKNKCNLKDTHFMTGFCDKCSHVGEGVAYDICFSSKRLKYCVKKIGSIKIIPQIKYELLKCTVKNIRCELY
ncbi:MAG: hypothetical protein DRO67_06880 [Candidatus Asgardarchaeum californiense]|nr:MAG: hypothetical protein DRO67_06880 [Candidatus Asgardarchaeum californiense]